MKYKKEDFFIKKTTQIFMGGRNFEHNEIGIKNSDYRTQLLGLKNTIFSTSEGLKNTLFFE